MKTLIAYSEVLEVYAELSKHHVEINVIEKCGEAPDGKVQYECEDSGFTEDPEKAALYIEGAIKWDGCSDWHTEGIHCCSKEQLYALGKIMAFCYDWTRDHLPTADKRLFYSIGWEKNRCELREN